MTATFGDLVLAAHEHLETAFAAWTTDPTAENTAAIIRSIHRAAKTMERCTGDIMADAPKSSVVNPDVALWWRAASSARCGLISASTDLAAGIQHFDRLGNRAFGTAAIHAGHAADLLSAARDLLRTHQTARSDNDQAVSDWSLTMCSATFSAALLTDIAQWSQQLAAWLSQQLPTDTTLPGPGRDLCLRACGGFWTAIAAIEIPHRQSPVPVTVRAMLHAIPPASLPQRQPPSGHESVSQLCDQIRITAQRVRLTVRRTARQAHWSPSTTASSWQWTAEAGVILSHITGLLLSSIASRNDLTEAFSHSAAHIRAAAQATARSHTCWQRAATTWDTVTTDTQGLSSPVITDLTDLLLRAGRITFDNPHWTPERHQRAPIRQPEDLASNPAQLTAVMTAIHETADALAHVAAADQQAIQLAHRAGRLHVPARCLPDEYDIPHFFAPATQTHLNTILTAYDAVTATSTYTAMTLEDLVLSTDAPSAPLATARKLARSADPARTPAHLLCTPPARRKADRDHPEPRVLGPVEKKLITLGVTDPFTLLQATAIDHAGRDLVAAAEQTSAKPTRPGEAPSASRRGSPHEHTPQTEVPNLSRLMNGTTPVH